MVLKIKRRAVRYKPQTLVTIAVPDPNKPNDALQGVIALLPEKSTPEGLVLRAELIVKGNGHGTVKPRGTDLQVIDVLPDSEWPRDETLEAWINDEADDPNLPPGPVIVKGVS